MTFYIILVAVNFAIAIANSIILFRSWRTMREVDRLQAETAKVLAQAQALPMRACPLDFPKQ
jgi:hypothetical protein